MIHKAVLGYKGFNADMTCQGFQYEVGKTYEMNGKIEPCERGFHFCRKMVDVFNYYGGESCRYAKVEALGKVADDGSKSVTDKLRIVRELSKAEVSEIMFEQAGMVLGNVPLPADEIIRAREDGTLGELLPSGTEFPVQFANGERNVLVVCRDKDHTYLVTEYIMTEKFAMNDFPCESGWPTCRMREHIKDIYAMLPEEIQKVTVPMHIKQLRPAQAVECDDRAFLLSAVNVFGKKTAVVLFGEKVWDSKDDCEDSEIDIFREPATRVKKRPGASSTSWWWLRSVYSAYSFINVSTGGSLNITDTHREGGVVVGFCIENRSSKS